MDITKRDFNAIIKAIREEDSRYSARAYYFLRQALDYSLKRIDQEESNNVSRHISGQELLEGIRLFALEQFGPMSLYLLNNWGVENCSDFGNIVFNLVESQVLGKTENDSPEDFMHGYDFNTAFASPFNSKDGIKYKKPRLL